MVGAPTHRMIVGKSKDEKRALHWRDIRKRVTTHEGEFLTGEKGRKYQKKWSKKYLGKDLGNQRRVTVFDVQKHERGK